MYRKQATFRFYEELNDFLPSAKVKVAFAYSFNGSPSVKDAVEALGVPHVEVDLILVNGQSADFAYRLQHGDYVSVYPTFETLDISGITRLREKPLRHTKLILDVHLGKLARYLRMLGFDTLYRNDYSDAEIVRLAVAERRIILTRDVGLLMAKAVTHGYWVRSQKPQEQVREVMGRFDLYRQINPFCRCIRCNGMLAEVPKASILDRLEPLTRRCYSQFYQCSGCGNIYWEGTHYERMRDFICNLKGDIKQQ
ncbi:Mut7-C RNAse domain-containing protein [uncultured Acetobacteroides sp.]|uniref:Mut7-C RNAse domain-containing protein n=1 Tax=uncultured Acetobacteroides sp. TaxID=1760811 RepID=UPI0029F55FD1|nr:Mut7-C RNAse domain-containing protein [uncultured Acetobacteroides sp.]